MEQEIKRRSPNYTLKEKQNLLSIVAKYKGVVESKKTGAYFIQRKKEVWTSITKQYNSVCTSGPRTAAMLKHLYNNMKHRARKKQKYINKILMEHNSQSADEVDEDITVEKIKDEIIIQESHEEFETDTFTHENHINDLTKTWTDEKITGGGTFIPTLAESEQQILSIVDDQIRPDMNPFDMIAVEYSEEPVKGDSPDTFIQPSQEPKLVERKQKKKFIHNRKSNNAVPYTKISAEVLKKIYLKKKIDLTFYQKKTEMLKFRNEQERHQMELKKYELQIKILQRQLES